MVGNKRGQNYLKREVASQLLRELITPKSCCQEGGFQMQTLIQEGMREGRREGEREGARKGVEGGREGGSSQPLLVQE